MCRQPGLLELLVPIARASGPAQATALSTISHLASCQEYCEALFDFPELVAGLVVAGNTLELREVAVRGLRGLSISQGLRKKLFDFLGLQPVMIAALKAGSGPAFEMLQRLTWCDENRPRIVNDSELMDILLEAIVSGKHPSNAYGAMNNLANSSSVVPMLLRHEKVLSVMDLMANMARGCPDPVNLLGFWGALVTWGDSAAREELTNRGLDRALREIIESPQSSDFSVFVATMNLSLLIGANEAKSMITADSKSSTLMIDGLIAVQQGKPFLNFSWALNELLEPIHHLCISDQNKPAFAANAGLGQCLVEIVSDLRLLAAEGEANSDNRSLSQGEKSVKFALETLQQIVFFHIAPENPEDGSKFLEILGTDSSVELKRALHRLREHPSFPNKDGVIASVNCLRRYLWPSEFALVVPESPASSAIDKPPKHVMISYAWAASKDIVVEITRALKERGVNTWRDEEGSDIVDPMQGSVDDTMGRAVECASDVIVFLSRAYKESANCQAEARYANVQRKRNQLKIHFVCLETNYTEPDGWLGFMLGDALWYPAFQKSQIQTTVDALTAVLKPKQAKATTSSELTKKSSNVNNAPKPVMTTAVSTRINQVAAAPASLKAERNTRVPSTLTKARTQKQLTEQSLPIISGQTRTQNNRAPPWAIFVFVFKT
eukprot:c17551_g1_i3.p1 GENE.c17551_g1_i3~~c17551_g1_i3.p1  ORF type:complete len:720 (+),score=155.27 c17551_g1_i3:167-2161(+)